MENSGLRACNLVLDVEAKEERVGSIRIPPEFPANLLHPAKADL